MTMPFDHRRGDLTRAKEVQPDNLFACQEAQTEILTPKIHTGNVQVDYLNLPFLQELS